MQATARSATVLKRVGSFNTHTITMTPPVPMAIRRDGPRPAGSLTLRFRTDQRRQFRRHDLEPDPAGLATTDLAKQNAAVGSIEIVDNGADVKIRSSQRRPDR